MHRRNDEDTSAWINKIEQEVAYGKLSFIWINIMICDKFLPFYSPKLDSFVSHPTNICLNIITLVTYYHCQIVLFTPSNA